MACAFGHTIIIFVLVNPPTAYTIPNIRFRTIQIQLKFSYLFAPNSTSDKTLCSINESSLIPNLLKKIKYLFQTLILH